MLCVNLMCSLNAMHTLSILRQNVNGSLSVVVRSMSVKVKQERSDSTYQSYIIHLMKRLSVYHH